MAAIGGVQLRRPLQSVRKAAEVFADRRRSRRQGALGGMTVIFPLASYRAFPPQVQGSQGVDLPGFSLADNHPVLLLHRGVGGGGFHPPELQRRPLVLVQVGKYRRRRDRFRRKPEGLTAAHCAYRRGNRRAILRYQQAGNAVISPHPVNVALHHRHAGRFSGLNCRVQIGNGRLLQTELAHTHHRTSTNWNWGRKLGDNPRN